MNNRGFTLVELIVVVTVIGILIGGAALSLTSHASNARDQRRKTDLLQIKSALEFYRADQTQGFYPKSTGSGATLYKSGSSYILVPNYIESVPKDPLTETKDYTYSATPAGCTNAAGNYCTSYELFIKPEGNYGVGKTTMYVTPLSVDVSVK